MEQSDKTFGVLTLATPNDYLKAIGLALSLRVSNPGVPIAVAAGSPDKIRALLEPYFDYVIDQDSTLKGFMHKVYLDKYSPFENTFYFDSDILVFKDLKPYIASWGDGPYYACGRYYDSGKSAFGLDRVSMMKKIGKPKMVEIGGAGHAFFRKPASDVVFNMAREITANYIEYAGDIAYADEDVINIVLTRLDIAPAPYGDFFSRTIGAKFGTLHMDAGHAKCHYVYTETNQVIEPCMMHFAAREAPIVYTWQLYKLFKQFGAPTKGLLTLCRKDFYYRYIKLKLNHYKRKVFGILGIAK